MAHNTRPTEPLPDWAYDPLNNTSPNPALTVDPTRYLEPGPTQKINGWALSDYPPSNWFNYFMFCWGAWIRYLAQNIAPAFLGGHSDNLAVDADGGSCAGFHEIIYQKVNRTKSATEIRHQVKQQGHPTALSARTAEEWVDNPGAPSGALRVWHVINATWNETTDLWEKRQAGEEAFAICRTQSGVTFYRQEAGTATWADSAWLQCFVSPSVLLSYEASEANHLNLGEDGVISFANKVIDDPGTDRVKGMASHAIAAFQAGAMGTGVVEIDGNHVASFPAASLFKVTNSAVNSLWYTVVSASYNIGSGNTEITVTGTVNAEFPIPANCYLCNWRIEADRPMRLRVSVVLDASTVTGDVTYYVVVNGSAGTSRRVCLIPAGVTSGCVAGSMVEALYTGDALFIVGKAGADAADLLSDGRVDINEVF